MFANLARDAEDVLARAHSVVKYAKGEVIVREGDVDVDNEMFFVLRGTARSVRGGGDELDAFVESVKGESDEKAGVTKPLQSFDNSRKRNARLHNVLRDHGLHVGVWRGASRVGGGGRLGVEPFRRSLWRRRLLWRAGAAGGRAEGGVVVAAACPACCSPRGEPRAAFELATTGTASARGNVAHSRNRATNEIESGWRRQRFRRELASVPLLAELGERERDTLAARCARVTFQPGAKIMRQGDEGDKFYILLKGSAVALKRDGKGKWGRHGWRRRPAITGCIAVTAPARISASWPLLTNKPRSATVVAQEKVVALVLDKNALVELRSTVPSLEDHIVRGMRHYDHIEMFTSMAMA